MARRQQFTDPLPMIEEQVDTGLSALLDSYRTNYNPSGEIKDDLNKRFTLLPNQRLPDFDNQFAKAFEATDSFTPGRPVYAMVCENSLPYRHTTINALLGVTGQNIVQLLGAGTVFCSHVNESRYVLFLERPQGIRLTEALKTMPRLHEHKLKDYIIQPAVRSLMALKEKKVSHGNISPSALFISDNSMLSECYSAPCGTQAHYIYEPLERLMCDPLGHGEATEKTDVYALGILAYEIMYGLDRIKAIPKEDFIRLAVNVTTYQILAQNRDFPSTMQDFFRGTLNDNPSDRWGLDQINQWLGGKNFNMIVPPLPKEAARPFTFGGENFVARRVLAHAFHRNWREAVTGIKTMKLERWCETSLHRPEMAERIERALRIAGEASTEKHVSDMMTRIITILDPIGPMRSMSVSVRPDAIGIMLADHARQGNTQEVNQLLWLIENDTSNYWTEQADANKAGDMSQTVWKLQRVRSYLKNKAFGFGVERVMYDLNPSMPCQSDLLKNYHILTAIDGLKSLDALAQHLAPDTSFADRHLAAFICSKIDLAKDMQLSAELAVIPELASDDELVVLKILAKAQQKNDKLSLVGLCTWAAMRIEKKIDAIHNRLLRKRLKLQLKRAASTGNIADVLSILVNREIAERDYQGFAKAIALHQINHKRIERYENPNLLDYRARDMGGKMSTIISYTILTITSYIVISNSLGF